MPEKIDNVLSWASTIDQGTIDQALKASRLPFVAGHLALMPDAHLGKGATVGSVIPTKGAIIPAAVGVDIGCGMIAVQTKILSSHLPDDLGPMLSAIEQAIPAGVGKGHDLGNDWDRMRAIRRVPEYTGASTLTGKQMNTIPEQFGTLGSGNHFVEVCLDENDSVWFVLHSGSRGIGNQLASAHIKNARGLMKERFITLEDPDLAYLVEGEPEFKAYIADMLWAQEYAMESREAMMNAMMLAVQTFFPAGFVGQQTRINCHHNYTEREQHNGQSVWLTRKGAIRARTGDLGVIPGSMGTGTYIVEGLGNPSSYNSCSHGAGRRMSRGQAKRELSVESLETAMKGKTWNTDRAEFLVDEHPDSYKDIESVMEDQKDLVKVRHHLTQVLNFKGQ